MVTRGKTKEVVLHVPSADVTNERGAILTEEERSEGRPDLEVRVDGSWRAVTPTEVASPVRQQLTKIIRDVYGSAMGGQYAAVRTLC